MADSSSQTPEQTPLHRNLVGKGGGWGREVGIWKGEHWQRSWGGEQKGDKGQWTRAVGTEVEVEDLLCRLPEMSRVGQTAVSLWQFLQHVHELGEGRSLFLFKGPAEEKNVLKETKRG